MEDGNSAWADRVVRIENVLQNGVPREVFAVMVGLGQYVNHYSGIKKAPNAKLAVRPEKGFNRGALQLMATNRNASGIAAGNEILLNYGIIADGLVPNWSQDSPAKRVHGVLEQMFERQEAEAVKMLNLQNIGSEQEGKKEEQEAEEPKKNEERKNKVEPKKKETPKKKEENKNQEEGKNHHNNDSQHEAPESPAGVKRSADGEPKGDMPLGTLTVPPCKVFIRGGAVMVYSESATNKKLSPGTVLALWTAGRFDKVVDGKAGDVPYTLPSATNVLCKSRKEVMKLSAMVKSAFPTATSIWGFQPFASAGAIPKTLVKKRDSAFFCTARETLPAAIAATNVSKGISIVIQMKFDEKTCVIEPQGVALVTTRQEILKSGENTLL